jgi:hypothetical protein
VDKLKLELLQVIAGCVSLHCVQGHVVVLKSRGDCSLWTWQWWTSSSQSCCRWAMQRSRELLISICFEIWLVAAYTLSLYVV